LAAVAEVTPGGRRERKKHQTSVALAEAALTLFAERGFAETTVEEIADAADMSARTFFRHFASKEAVLFADDDERREIWIGALRNRPLDESVLTTIREAALALAADYTPAKDFVRFDLARRHRSIGAYWFAIGVGWENVLAEEIAARLELSSKYDVTPRTLAAAAMGAWRVAQANWAYDRGRRSLREHVEHSFTVLARLGALTPPARATSTAVVDVRGEQPQLTETQREAR
jgi:AcrR family transcriptional regulator